jgi:hypothetical protein
MQIPLLEKIHAAHLKELAEYYLDECIGVGWDITPYDFSYPAPRASLHEEASVKRLTSDVSRWSDL